MLSLFRSSRACKALHINEKDVESGMRNYLSKSMLLWFEKEKEEPEIPVRSPLHVRNLCNVGARRPFERKVNLCNKR